MSKISIRFYNDREVRAVWDEERSKWWFSAVDIVAAITDSPNPSNLASPLTAPSVRNYAGISMHQGHRPDALLW